MSIHVPCGGASAYVPRTTRRLGGFIASAAVIVGLALDASSGASAQCVGTYHPSSGGGAHSPTQGTGAHPVSSTTHAAASPSCLAGGTKTANASNLSVHPAAGLGAGKVGTVSSWRHTASQAGSAGVNKMTSDKKVGGQRVRP